MPPGEPYLVKQMKSRALLHSEASPREITIDLLAVRPNTKNLVVEIDLTRTYKITKAEVDDARRRRLLGNAVGLCANSQKKAR